MKVASRIISAILLSLSMGVPANAALIADQGEYTQHVLDCLGMLFNSEKHATECGGPFGLIPPSDLHENMPPPPAPVCVSNLAPLPGVMGIDWQLRVAGDPCCVGLSSPSMQQFFALNPNGRLLVAC